MADIPRAISAEEFMALLVRSKLATADDVSGWLNSYREANNLSAKIPESLASFCNYLIRTDVLTRWQCDKLRNRQWKGFFLDSYRLLEHMGDEGGHGCYLARDSKNGNTVRLKIAPFSQSKGPGIDCKIEPDPN